MQLYAWVDTYFWSNVGASSKHWLSKREWGQTVEDIVRSFGKHQEMCWRKYTEGNLWQIHQDFLEFPLEYFSVFFNDEGKIDLP